MIAFSVNQTFSYTLLGAHGSLQMMEPGESTFAKHQSERQMSLADVVEAWGLIA